MKTTDPPVIVEQSFKTTADKIWRAITSHNEMVQWYFENIPDFRPEVGFETQFNIHNEGRDFLHIWKVTDVIPFKIITYNWTFEAYPGSVDVTFELSQDGNNIKLTVTNKVIKDFPDDIPEFKRESCLGGWEYFIQQSLKEYLDK